MTLGAIRESGLTIEECDADAVALGLHPGQHSLIIQIKFAHDGANIAPDELRGICDSLVSASERIEAKYGRVVEDFVLLSNRPLSPHSNSARERAVAGKPPTAAWASTDDRYTKVLSRLQLKQISSQAWLLEQVVRFGASLGARPSESLDGARTLLADIFLGTASGGLIEITERTIARAITESSTAQPLRTDRVRLVSTDIVREMLAELSADTGSTFVSREVLRDLERAATAGAVVVLSGSGGSGKSVAAALWLLNRVKLGETRIEAFAGVAPARQVDGNLARRLFQRWLGMNEPHIAFPSSAASLSEIVERCARSFEISTDDHTRRPHEELLGTEGPFFTLLLDGIDELASPNANLDSALRWFADEHRRTLHGHRPSAMLIVTTRRERELHHLVTTFTSGYASSAVENYAVVKVGEFSSEELFEAMHGLEPEIASAVANYFPTPAALSMQTLPPIGGVVDSTFMSRVPAPAPLPSIVKALRQPSLFGAFARLDSPTRKLIFAGDLSATRGLAESFLAWALKKMLLRKGGSFADLDSVVRHLFRIAQELRASDVARSRPSVSLWDRTFQSSAPHPFGGRPLGEELATAGVVELDANDTWYWQHDLVGEYLSDTVRQNALIAKVGSI